MFYGVNIQCGRGLHPTRAKKKKDHLSFKVIFVKNVHRLILILLSLETGRESAKATPSDHEDEEQLAEESMTESEDNEDVTDK